MSPEAQFRAFSTLVLTSLATSIRAKPVKSQSPPPSASAGAESQAQAEMSRLFAGILSDTSSHMRMGPTRAATAADSARAAAIVVAARAALSQYTDVKVAERDGYYRAMPRLEDQPIYHYNSMLNFSAAGRGEFDVTKPVSLLYKKDGEAGLKLIGAMYATSESAAPEKLDALLPISMAHWHEHVNLCSPGSAPFRNARTIDAATVFWMRLYFSITSAAECDAAGGRFVPVEFGWMAHVYMFAGDDPKVIWDADDVGNMDMHMRHAAADTRP
jgi:hypothetical protein